MKTRTTGAIVVAVSAAAVAVLFAVNRTVAVEAAYPIERVCRVFADKVCTRITGFFRGASACAENVRLRREVASLQLLQGENERLEVENDRLRRALEYKSRGKARWQVASVLSEGGGASGAGGTLRVDKGSLSRVKVGAIAVVPEGLVGRVSHVTPHTAEITLLGDSSLKVACEVETVDGRGPRGILAGGSDTYVLKHVTSATTVPPRSRVLTSGLGGVFPRGIEVGTLLQFKMDDMGRPLEGEVLPSVDASELHDVFIRCDE